MQNIISFVNEQLNWEEESPHRHDCHDPPHTAGMGFLDDRSPPRRLPAVARSDPWKATPAQVGFTGCAMRSRRSPWVVESDLWCNSRGGDYLRSDRRREDCHPEQELCPLDRSHAANIELGCLALTCMPKGYLGSHWPSNPGLIELAGSNCNPGPRCACSCVRFKSARCLGIPARRGTRRQRIAPPTPHETLLPPLRPPQGRFQPSAQGITRKQFEFAHLCSKCQPCTRRAPSWGPPLAARE
jgi:hypothetical protein